MSNEDVLSLQFPQPLYCFSYFDFYFFYRKNFFFQSDQSNSLFLLETFRKRHSIVSQSKEGTQSGDKEINNLRKTFLVKYAKKNI